ncbi:MAG: hypothetical protein PVF73_09275, partial [Bacteroidales bacterium]
MQKILYALYFVFILTIGISAQDVYIHISNQSIYTFLDEMASEKFIELNSAVKPYTRRFIAEKLDEITQHAGQLNKRQQKELEFYLKDFNKELKPGKTYKKRIDILYYKDSLFTFSLNPILGIQYWNNENGSNYHRWNGAEVFAYAGKHLGVYASLRDNHEEKLLSDPAYINTRQGAVYKAGQDFSEMRGGFIISWKWGNIGLVKDHMEWGNYYHYPSIISGKVPSVAQIKLNLKPVRWFEFNYFHGWLVSGVVDSARSYTFTNGYGTSTREVFFNKYMAANLFTFKPLKNLYASIGNSVVYSADNVHPAYLIPFMLYKSTDHTLSNYKSNYTGQNSQFFFDISSRQIRHLHVYASFYFDDISFTRLKEQGRMGYNSINTGLRLSDLIPNTSVTFEYFQSYPNVYKHNMPTTTYESNFYNLGHYMLDNSRSYYLEILFKPVRGLDLKTSYHFAQHGPDHTELGTNRIEVVNYFLDTVEWETEELALYAGYQVINDVFVFGEVRYRNTSGDVEKYTAEYYRGETTTFSVGLNWG